MEQKFDLKLDDQKTRARWVQFFDLLIMGIFFGYYAYWRWRTTQIAKQIEKDNVTTGDYSLYITNLPETGITEKDIKEFFS